MDLESEDEDEEESPRYSVILFEEEYEDEDAPESWERSPLQDNFEPSDPSPEIQGWDPREAHCDFFRFK